MKVRRPAFVVRPKHVSPHSGEAARLALNVGAGLLRQGKPEEAIHHLEQALAMGADRVATQMTLGAAYVMARRFKEAVPVLEAARDAEPDNPLVWLNLGAAHLGNPVLAGPRQQALAISAFSRAAEIDPATPSAFYNLGLVHADRGEADLARQAFLRALEVCPDDRDAALWLRRLENQR